MCRDPGRAGSLEQRLITGQSTNTYSKNIAVGAFVRDPGWVGSLEQWPIAGWSQNTCSRVYRINFVQQTIKNYIQQELNLIVDSNSSDELKKLINVKMLAFCQLSRCCTAIHTETLSNKKHTFTQNMLYSERQSGYIILWLFSPFHQLLMRIQSVSYSQPA